MSEPGAAQGVPSSEPVLATVLAPVPPPQAFGIGRAIARTFSTWRSNVVAFSVLGLASYLPTLVFSLVSGVPVQGVTAPAVNPFDRAAVRAVPPLPPAYWIVYALTFVVLAWEMAAVTEGVLQHLAGRRPSLRAMVSVGLRRWLPVLGVGLLSYVMFAVGLLLLVVPGVFLSCAIAVAIPAAAVERPGVFGAVSRSFALTKGNRLAILVVGLIFLFVSFGMSFFSVYLLPQLTPFAPALGLILGSATSAVFGSVILIAPAVVFHDLRVAKEGRATAELEAVFE